MKHLRYLQIVNYVFGALLALAALVLLAISMGLVGGELTGVTPTQVQVANTALVVATIVTAVLAVLAFWTGTLVRRARGRLLQTVLAVVNVLEFPLGTAYGLYALFVCWVNEPTKEAFSTDTAQPV